jgi:RNA polymerase sigma-70 factor (ECF subfamily)
VAIVREPARVEFEWVFRSAYPSVLRTAYLVTRDRGRAEEVTQDAFLRLYERWRSVARVEHPEAWVRKVAVRAAVRQAQRNRRVQPTDHVESTGSTDAVPDVDLDRAIAALAPRQRAAVALFYLEDRPVEEVAELMRVSVSTVKQHLFRARAHLATQLQEEEVSGDVD